jgi:tetratricopeptide (TPR) repeat protein
MEQVLELALQDAERAGAHRERSRILRDLARATVIGPRPVEAGILRCHEILRRADDDLTTTAVANAMIAVLEAMRSDFGTAREHWARSRRRLEDLGLSVTLAGLRMYCAFIELMAGDPQAAEAAAADAYAVLERAGERRRLPTTAALLARAHLAQDRLQEAERYSRVSEESASKDDFVSQAMWRGTRARVLARTGEPGHAKELARSGVALAGETDFLWLHADALIDLADVVAVLGRPREAARHVDEAIDLYVRKGVLVGAERARELRATLPRTPALDARAFRRV